MRVLAAFCLLVSLSFAQDQRPRATLVFPNGNRVDHDSYWSPATSPTKSLRWYPVASGLIPDAVKAQAPNIVRTTSRAGRATNGGSGTYLGDRLVLICRHTIGNRSMRCYFDSAIPKFFIDGIVIARMDGLDSALVELETMPPLPGIRIAIANPIPGDASFALGYATGRLGCHVGQIRQYVSGGNYIEQSGGAISGDSGGPLLNSKGELVGNLWGGGRNTTVGLPTDRTRKFLEPYADRLTAWYAAIETDKPPWTLAQNCPPGGGWLIPSRPGPGRPPRTIPIAPAPIQTPQMPPKTPDLSIGSVTTLEPGSDATAQIRDVGGGKYVLDLGIPTSEPPATRVQFLDGEGEVFAEQIVQSGEPLQIPSISMEILDGDNVFRQSRALGEGPIRLRVEGLIDAR